MRPRLRAEVIRARRTPKSDLLEIQITTDITEVVNRAETALLAVPNGPYIFQRLQRLCLISHDGASPKWLRRPVGAPTIAYCTPDQLRERMSASAQWQKWDARTEDWVNALPPTWAVETLLGRLRWKFSILASVITSPTLREDGAIISTPGYDSDTGLFLDTQGVIFPPIPDHPTMDGVVRAVDDLKEPFADFPFAEEHDLSAALSATLSLAARPAINGNVPLFAVDSSTRGTGKGLLIDILYLTLRARCKKGVESAT